MNRSTGSPVLLRALLICFCVALPAAAAEYHVDAQNGDDSNSGLSWSTPLATIGAALTLTTVTPEDDIIRVAEGIYRENLVVGSGVTLEGGYPGGGGARDPRRNNTTIDGDRQDSTVIVGPDATGVVIDGFEITGGEALIGGGGIYADASQVVIRNNVVSGNTVPTTWGRGGGIFLYGPLPAGASSIITNNEIRGNGTDDGNGGGIAVLDDLQAPGPPVEIRGNTIESNTASGYGTWLARGGGIYVAYNDSVIEDNEILDNRARAQGIQDYTGNGGGILILEANPVVTRNTIRGNLAQGAGGTFSGSGGGFYGFAFSGEIADNEVVSNTADAAGGDFSAFGGGIFVYSGAPSITGNLIQGNSLDADSGCSVGRGGGVYLTGGPASLADNRIIGNDNYKEGVPADGPCWTDLENDPCPCSSGDCNCFQGGGLWSWQEGADALTLEENLIEANVAHSGGAMILAGRASSTLSHNRIRRNEAPGDLSAGVVVFWEDPVLFNNEIVENVGDGVLLVGDETDPAGARIRNATIARNGQNCPGPLVQCGVGLRVFYADGLEVRNSIIFGSGLSDWINQPVRDPLDNTPSTQIFGFDYTDVGDNVMPGTGNIALDPLFVSGPFGNFYLGALASGQGADSPCLDSGGDQAAALNLDSRTTQSSDLADQGTVDMGFHYPRFNTTGGVFLWRTERVGMDLRLRYGGDAAADGHRIYRGELARLAQGDYSHQSPFSGGGAECFVPNPETFVQVPDGMADPGSFYFLVVPITGSTEGDFGAADLDGDGVPESPRVRPEESGSDDVRNNCP